MGTNTLQIKDMKIVRTQEFLKQFMGKPLTFWVGHEPILFGISEPRSVKFIDKDDDPMIIFQGKPNEAFGAGFNYGFGLKIRGEQMEYWVDKINEEEAAVIVYSSDGDDEAIAGGDQSE